MSTKLKLNMSKAEDYNIKAERRFYLKGAGTSQVGDGVVTIQDSYARIANTGWAIKSIYELGAQ